jgi:serine protease Do
MNKEILMIRNAFSRGLKATVFIMLLALVMSLSTVLYGAGTEADSEKGLMFTSEPAETLSTIDALEVMQDAYREVARRVVPVVVEINVTDVVTQRMPDFGSPFEFFFGPQREREPEEREFRRYGLGSGVIIRRSGEKVYVLTNNHVVGGADEIVVTLHDERRFTATLVGKDPRKDLALVEFETDEEVPIAVLGSSDTVQVGDIVFAVGNPLGFESTITSGIVSAVGRKPVPGAQVAGFTDYIQTDAAINQGNSGGPLVNIRGEVIGINTWISSTNGGSIGLGFTIPIDNAKQAIEDFITKGGVDYGWLGINIADPPAELKRDMGIENMQGSFVFGVFQGSPANKAGILPGDYITAINGEKVTDTATLSFTVAELPVGKAATFDLIRYGEAMRIQVKISARDDEIAIREQRSNVWPGMSVVHITPEIQKQLNLPKKMGELVIGNVTSGGPAALAGFRPGDMINEINGEPVRSTIDFYRSLNDSKAKELVFRIYRQGNELIIGLIRK